MNATGGEASHAAHGAASARTELVGLLLFAAAAVLSLYVHTQGELFPEDDAFISYRYVRQLVAGNGLVYNVGQRVFGSSTPLYVLWLAALKWLLPSIDVPVLAVRANGVFLLAAALGVVALLRATASSRWLPSVGGIIFLVSPIIVRRAVDGTEALLFTALMVWTLWALAATRLRLAALLAGLSVLARPEGMLCVGIVGLRALLQARQAGWASGALLLAPLGLWSAFATSYYGSPIPHSLIAKARPLYALPAGYAWGQLSLQIQSWSSWLNPLSAALPAVVAVTLLAGGLAGAWLSRGSRPQDWWSVPTLFAGLVGFYAFTNPLLFAWYYGHVWTAWFLAVLTGWIRLGMSVDGRGIVGARGAPVATTVCAAVVVGLTGSAAMNAYRGIDFSGPDRFDEMHALGNNRRRIVAYQQAADWLNPLLVPGARIAAPEIGALGYYSRGYILDACGLVTPEALPFLPVPANQTPGPDVGTISVDFVRATDPDFVVTLWAFAQKSLFASDWFFDRYQLVNAVRLQVPTLDSTAVLIFARKPDDPSG